MNRHVSWGEEPSRPHPPRGLLGAAYLLLGAGCLHVFNGLLMGGNLERVHEFSQTWKPYAPWLYGLAGVGLVLAGWLLIRGQAWLLGVLGATGVLAESAFGQIGVSPFLVIAGMLSLWWLLRPEVRPWFGEMRAWREGRRPSFEPGTVHEERHHLQGDL